MENWSGWSEVARKVASSTQSYLKLGPPDFRAEHRLDQMTLHLKERGFVLAGDVATFTSNPEARLDAIKSEILELILEGYDALVGIPNKGLSILLEVADLLAIPRSNVLDSTRLLPAQVKGRKILVFDDTIHEGKCLPDALGPILRMEPAACIVYVAWMSDEGKRAVNKSFESRDVLLRGRDVPERFFSTVFQLEVSPMIYALRTSTVGQRPYRVIEVSSMRLAPDQLAERLLTTLATLPSIECLVDPPPQDGRIARIFHGTLEVSDQLKERAAALFSLDAGDLEMHKVRLFIEPGEPFRVFLHGVGWPEPSACPDGNGPAMDSAISDFLVGQIGDEALIALRDQGLSTVLGQL